MRLRLMRCEDFRNRRVVYLRVRHEYEWAMVGSDFITPFMVNVNYIIMEAVNV